MALRQLSTFQSPSSSRALAPPISSLVQSPARSRRSRSVQMAPQASLNLAPEFGYVLGAAAFTGVVYLWQSLRVGAARRKYGVKYPTMYATGDDQDSKTFNCIQRSHQNSSETIGPIMISAALLGLYHPITAASLNAAWAVGRIMYTIGYSTGDPSKRTPGAVASSFSFLGLIVGLALVGFRTVTKA